MKTISFNPTSLILNGSGTLAQILDYGWLIVLGVLIVGALLYALVALWKGIYKTTLKFIIMGGGFCALIFLMPQIVNAIAGFDLSTFGGGFNVTIAGNSYHFGVLDEVIADILINLEMVTASSVGDLYRAAIVLSHSLIGFVLYFVGVLVLILLAPFISGLLYHIIFKWFIPKKTRKKHKLRLVSLFEGFVCGLVSVTLLMTPLTSFVSQISKQDEAYNTLVEKGIIPENYKQYTDVLMSYDESVLFKTMTMGTDDPSKGIDAKIIQNVSKVIINGETYSIYDEVANLLSMIPTIAQNLEFVVDSAGNQAINLTKLLQVTTVDALISTLSNSNLLSLLIPAFVEMGINQVDINAEGQRLDFDGINWNNEIDAIGDLYKALYDAGLIDSALQVMVNHSDFTIDLKGIDALKKYFTATLNDKDNVLAKNLPVLLAHFGNTLNLPFIPSSADVYENINFGTEISTILEVAYGLIEVLAPTNNGKGVVTLTPDTLSSMPTTLLNILENPMIEDPKHPGEKIVNEKYNKLRSLIIGSKTQKGILDLQLVKDDVFKLDKILKSFLGNVDGVSAFIDDDTYKKMGEFVTDKKEIGILLDSAASILELTNGFDITKSTDRDKIIKILDQLKESAIFKDIIPNLLKNVLNSQPQFNDMLFGIQISDLDFECKDKDGNSILVDELKKILNIVEDALAIVAVVNDPNNVDASSMFKALDTTLLKNVLLGVYDSKIINPVKLVTGDNGAKKFAKDVNFNKLIKGILSQQAMIDAGIVLPNDLSEMKWYEKKGEVESGEIINLLKAVDELKKNTYLIEPNFDIGALTDEQLDGLGSLLTTISESKLIENSLPSILNKTVGSTIGSFFGEGTNVKINFYNVEDWTSETNALVNIIKKTKALNNGSFDFSSIDFKSFTTPENEEQLAELLTAIADCSLFGVHQLDSGYYSDNFGELLYGTIDKFGMEDILGSGVDHNLFTCVTNKNTGAYDKDYWTGPNSDSSEIRKVAHMIIEFNNANNELGEGGLTGGAIDPSLLQENGPVEKVLYAVMDTRTFNGILNGALESICSQVTIMEGNNAVNLSLINLKDLSKEDVRLLLNLYSKADSLQSLFGGGTVKISNENIIAIADLLNDIASCDMFTTVKDGEMYSLFDELMASILNVAKLDTLLLGLDETNEHLREYTLLKVDQIDGWSALDSTKFSEWKTLINSTSADGKSGKTFNYEELRVSANKNNSEILRIMNVLKVVEATGIDYSNLSNVASLETSTINNVLNSINDSHLVHRAVPNLFNDILSAESGMNIDQYTTIKDGAGNILKSYEVNTKVHIDFNEENRLYWKHEIDCVTRLYESLVQLSGGGTPDLGNIKFDADNFDSYSVIEPIANINIFESAKHAMIYNIFRDVQVEGQDGILDFIRGEGPLEKADMIRSFYFPINASNEYLQRQCKIIDNLIKQVANGNIDVKSTAGSTRLTELILSSYDFDIKEKVGETIHYEEKYVRGYLSQELVSGLLYNSFSKTFPAELDFFKQVFSREANVRQYNDFAYLNAVELNGIQGLFKLVEAATIKNLSDDASFTKCLNLISEGFKLMGREKPAVDNYDDTNALDVLLHMNEADIYNGSINKPKSEYSLYINTAGNSLANSILAKKLIMDYAGDITIIPAVVVGGSVVTPAMTLEDIINKALSTTPGLNYNDVSFEKLGAKVVETINVLRP